MKKTKAILILSIVSIVFFGCKKSDNIPKGWFKDGSDPNNYIIGIDDNISKSGQRSAFIETIEEKEEGFCSLTQWIHVYTISGKKIRMTGYIKTENAGWAAMWVRVDNNKREVLSFDNMSDRPIKGTQDWTKCEIVLDVPKNSYYIFLGVLLSEPGKAWFDDISFEDYDEKIPPVSPDESQKPTNLDFEE